jgi:hypothetical protein
MLTVLERMARNIEFLNKSLSLAFAGTGRSRRSVERFLGISGHIRRRRHRDVALLLFAIYEGCAGGQLDGGNLAERHLNLAIRPLRANGDVANGVEILPVTRGETHHHREMPVASFLIEVAGPDAAQDHAGPEIWASEFYRRADA